MVNITPPWMCHMLAVFLAAYVGARLFRNPFLALVAATAIGVGFACTLGAFPQRWLEAYNYAMYVYGFRTLSRDPEEFITAFFLCWIAPILIAWVTVRARTQPRPPEGEAPGP